MVIFDLDNSSSKYADNRKIYISVPNKGPAGGFDDATITKEAKYAVNITKLRNEICSSLHYNWSNSFLYVNCGTVYQFKAKEFEIKTNTFCLGNNSKDITTDNMKISGLNGSVYDIFVAYNTITVNYVENDHKCLMKKHNIVCAGAIVVRFS